MDLILEIEFATQLFRLELIVKSEISQYLGLIKVPDAISNDTAASILLKGMTVEYLFERLYKIKKDEYILFHAAAGGVGLIACQWAKSIGCKMIGTVSTNEKAELAKKNGCYIHN